MGQHGQAVRWGRWLRMVGVVWAAVVVVGAGGYKFEAEVPAGPLGVLRPGVSAIVTSTPYGFGAKGSLALHVHCDAYTTDLQLRLAPSTSSKESLRRCGDDTGLLYNVSLSPSTLSGSLSIEPEGVYTIAFRHCSPTIWVGDGRLRSNGSAWAGAVGDVMSLCKARVETLNGRSQLSVDELNVPFVYFVFGCLWGLIALAMLGNVVGCAAVSRTHPLDVGNGLHTLLLTGVAVGCASNIVQSIIWTKLSAHGEYSENLVPISQATGRATSPLLLATIMLVADGWCITAHRPHAQRALFIFATNLLLFMLAGHYTNAALLYLEIFLLGDVCLFTWWRSSRVARSLLGAIERLQRLGDAEHTVPVVAALRQKRLVVTLTTWFLLTHIWAWVSCKLGLFSLVFRGGAESEVMICQTVATILRTVLVWLFRLTVKKEPVPEVRGQDVVHLAMVTLPRSKTATKLGIAMTAESFLAYMRAWRRADGRPEPSALAYAHRVPPEPSGDSPAQGQAQQGRGRGSIQGPADAAPGPRQRLDGFWPDSPSDTSDSELDDEVADERQPLLRPHRRPHAQRQYPPGRGPRL